MKGRQGALFLFPKPYYIWKPHTKTEQLEFPNYIQANIKPEVIHTELEKGFPYYRSLNKNLKVRFVERLGVFIAQKKFVGRQNLLMTDKIRILVSACAVQVTFGLDSFTLDNFEYIVIYPDIYESPMTHKMHKGETNLNGFICLSWKHILEGIENPDDNYNLGIHEWTHALRFNGINYEETDYFFDGYINKWVSAAMPEYNNLRTGKKSIFRRYGATNIHEFLSVVTEHFFESPEEFKSNAPLLFEEMCILLNQLPSKTESPQLGRRYALLNEIPKEATNLNPLFVLEASFFRTVLNFGAGLLYYISVIILLALTNSFLGYCLCALVVLAAIVKMNYQYFTIKFYEDYLYIQRGFFTKYASRLSITYRCLIKVEIFDGNFDSYSTATVFQFNYYRGNAFLKKATHCSAIDIPHQQIIDLLHKKKVATLIPIT